MPFAKLLWGVVLALLLVVVFPGSARAEVKGELPPPAQGGLALVVYTSGGDTGELREELFDKGCGLVSVFSMVQGRFVGYVIGAPALVNKGFLQAYPEGQIPPRTPLVVRCRQGGTGGPEPEPVSRTGQANRITPVQGRDVPLRYECGDAVFEITNWYLPQNLTDQLQQGDVFITYKVPADGVNYDVGIEIDILDGNGKILGYLGNPLGIGSVVFDTDAPFGVSVGIRDGRFHKADVRTYRILTEAEVDRGAPHFTTVQKGGRFSDKQPFPFYVGTPPIIRGHWQVGNHRWFIDTSGIFPGSSEDYCKES